jgi:ribosomal protein L11 methyltransferase
VRTWPALDLVAREPDRLPSDVSDRLALILDDLAPVALEDCEDHTRCRVYFAAPLARDEAASSLREGLGDVYEIVAADVEDEGWVHKVQDDLRAVRIGRIVVAPPWDCAAASPDDLLIVIEPSMGFGTGHHQSTRLCLQALQALPLAATRVLDVGTGSGVLAIATARLGARAVLALDNDPDSITAARENVARNRVDAVVDVRLAALGDHAPEAADTVVANLTAWLLSRHAGPLAASVGPAGRLVVSGFTVDQVPLVEHALVGFVVEARREEDEWVALTLRRP